MINKVFGVGGIGTGMFFNLKNNHSLGRDESRPAFLTDYRDYCKQHIILHYMAKLTTDIDICAIGKVGSDEQGNTLISQMKSAGISTKYLKTSKKAPTMLSVCFQYPDGSGGNITTSNSACNLVSPDYVDKCSEHIDADTLLVAVPEVSLESRIKLLETGRKRGSFNVASFLSGEVEEFESKCGYELSDLLAINLDEAKAVCRLEDTVEKIAEAASEKIVLSNPAIKIIITAGKSGCFTYENGRIEKISIIDIPVVSTAGAGDALLGGTIAGLLNGLPFQKKFNDEFFNETSLTSAVELGTIVSTFAVMSPDTISDKVSWENLRKFIKQKDICVSNEFASVIHSAK